MQPKRIFLFLLLLTICLTTPAPGAGSEPVLRNEMPENLLSFQEMVARQAREFPEFFFLSRPDLEQKLIALSFDDGPDRKYTPAILDILEEKEVPATFFLLGEAVEANPDIVRRISDEGHLIGNHSWSHPDFRDLHLSEIKGAEIEPTGTAIAAITGEKPHLIRPPYGAINDQDLQELGKQGWKIINWSVDSFDWLEGSNSPEQIRERVLQYVRPGDIILLHSAGGNRSTTVEALPGLIQDLQERGFDLITIDQLLEY